MYIVNINSFKLIINNLYIGYETGITVLAFAIVFSALQLGSVVMFACIQIFEGTV